MFFRHFKRFGSKFKFRYCDKDETDYLKKNNVFPISSIEQDDGLKWVFVDNKEVNSLLAKIE